MDPKKPIVVTDEFEAVRSLLTPEGRAAQQKAAEDKHLDRLGERKVVLVATADGERRQVATYAGAFVCSVKVGRGMGLREARAKAFDCAKDLGWSPAPLDKVPEWFRRVSGRPPRK